MSLRDAAGPLVAALGNLFAWVASSEEIWFSVVATYIRFIAPETALPDLRGPFLFLTLCYLGLRLADLWDAKDEVDDTL
ncbi:hypothetical protein [Halorarum salinum]|uniref:Uncharacterized protein n=1 Tax=Halorarum salinum TaxID=2743089 RepID=A0A7D5QB09_9EURY|nr:hypothetical protein [Halobaculum salinum]QLG62198.1 hypothetical protein HUG12_10835 [Halobaculum salinum]